jgi:hypothetical protein
MQETKVYILVHFLTICNNIHTACGGIPRLPTAATPLEKGNFICNPANPLILTIGVQTKENLHIDTVEMVHEPFLHKTNNPQTTEVI